MSRRRAKRKRPGSVARASRRLHAGVDALALRPDALTSPYRLGARTQISERHLHRTAEKSSQQRTTMQGMADEVRYAEAVVQLRNAVRDAARSGMADGIDNGDRAIGRWLVCVLGARARV